MEVDEELLRKAIEQAIASVSIEFDGFEYVENIQVDKQKILVLKGVELK